MTDRNDKVDGWALTMAALRFIEADVIDVCAAVERDDVAAAEALRPELAAVNDMSAIVYNARRAGLADALTGDGITPCVRAFVASWRRTNPFADAAAAARARLFASRTPRARRRALTAGHPFVAVRLDSEPTSKLTAPRPVRFTPTLSL
jgi:hypothetical protein